MYSINAVKPATAIFGVAAAILTLSLLMGGAPSVAHAAADLSITCGTATNVGTLWTFSGTWKAVDYVGVSTAYNAAMFSPSGTLKDSSSKDAPDTFVITQGPNVNFAGASNKDDMQGTWSNQITFAVPPTSVAATLYHQGVPGNEASGDATCSFNQQLLTGGLTVTKVVINDIGGAAQVSDFTLKVGNTTVVSGASNQFTGGAYVVSETGGPTGYAASFSGDCDAQGNVTVVNGQSRSCTITNNDIAPLLTITKVVVNNDTGVKVVADFPLYVGVTQVLSGVQNIFFTGTYTVSETADVGYTSAITGDCAQDGSITLALGDVKSCTITNDDVAAPPPATEDTLQLCTDTVDNDGDTFVDLDDTDCAAFVPKLTVTKVVVNDIGGTKVPSDFALFIDAAPVTSTVQATVSVGAHTVSETPDVGYAGTITGDCAADGSITLAAGDVKSCTITNDDIAPLLTVTKVVVNNDTGVKVVADFPLFVGPTGVTSGVQNIFFADTYVVSETPDAGYNATITGDCAANGSITLALGDVKSCTITNDDVGATPPPPTTPLGQCEDTLDNDGDGLVDAADPACHLDNNPSNPSSYFAASPSEVNVAPGQGGGGGGGGAFGGGLIGGVNGGGVLGVSTGQVLGESCGLYMNQHLRKGSFKNNSEQVTKLQQFLVNKGFATFAPTGTFGPMTEAAVKAFQAKYADDVLKPWGLNTPSGLVYLTTLYKLNLLECPELSAQLPELVPWSQNPNAQ